MKQRIIMSCLLVWVVWFMAAPPPGGCETEQRIALVIGNGGYQQGPLRNPVNDANDMAATLSGAGFTVMKHVDADRAAMREAIRQFGDQIKRGGVGLFFYAGHGIQVRGENYLVPIGAKVAREDEVEDECLKVSSVLRKMETAGNRLNIIILDACRNNPFGRSFRSSQEGLAKMDAPTGSLLAYATAPGSVAADGTGRNGLYTSQLLKHMRTPGVEILSLFRKVRVDVMAESKEQQVPWESTSLTGEFFFVPLTAAAGSQPSSGPQPVAAVSSPASAPSPTPSASPSPDKPASADEFLQKFFGNSPSTQTASADRGWVGMEIQDLTEEIASQLGLSSTSGALVVNLFQGGPAETGGLKKGDVITIFNGTPVLAAGKLAEMVRASPNRLALVTVIRDGREQVVPVQVGKAASQ